MGVPSFALSLLFSKPRIRGWKPHCPVHGRFSAPPRWLLRACCSAPDWLQTIAKINPLYHTVAGMRALFNATYGDGEIVVGLVVLVALTVVTLTLGARSFASSAA